MYHKMVHVNINSLLIVHIEYDNDFTLSHFKSSIIIDHLKNFSCLIVSSITKTLSFTLISQKNTFPHSLFQ